jgi:CRISPR/Cas system-associated exonuclease Cas4 (RecB family)
MKTSYSKVNTFFFCAKKYEYRYILERPTPPKPELVFGIALHAALEANFRQKIETRRDLPVEKLLTVFSEEFKQGLEGVVEEKMRGALDFHYLQGMGHYFLETFMKERAPAIQPAPRGVECFFSLPLPGGHEVTGKFDLLDADWVLHDFKTSNKLYDPRTADKTQLVIYAWACERLFGRPPKALCFDVFVKGDGQEGRVMLQEPVVFPVPSPAEMAGVAARLASQVDRIGDAAQREAFPWAFEPPRCHWCEYQDACLEDWDKHDRPRPVKIRMESLVRE